MVGWGTKKNQRFEALYITEWAGQAKIQRSGVLEAPKAHWLVDGGYKEAMGKEYDRHIKLLLRGLRFENTASRKKREINKRQEWKYCHISFKWVTF